MNITNLKIGTRLIANNVVMGLLLLVCISLGITMLGRVNGGTTVIVTDSVPKAAQATQAMGDINDIAIALSSMLLNEDSEVRKAQQANIEKSRIGLQEKLGYLRRTVELPKGKKLLQKSLDADARYAITTNQLLTLLATDRPEVQKAYLHQMFRPALVAYKAAINDMIAFEVERMNAYSDHAATTYANSRLMMLVLGATALLFAAGMGVWITLSITRPLNRALTLANTVAAGDLTSRIEARTTEETGQLLAALKNMNDSLMKIVAEVRNGTEAIASASSQIATGNLDLSSRTEQQASSLEETASSMEELTSTVRQNADHAREANALALLASQMAVKGGAVVLEVVETMSSINESSSKIVDIISVIDGIAFQTNILALNAAVEAARAGEEGRGFAVVAAEVRMLAQRSAAAAKEIKVLIDNSVGKVDAGSKLVERAGATMDEIVDSVKRVGEIMGKITAAAQEQTAGIEQVNQAIGQMDQVTQQNAALVEEAAAAARSMQAQVANLAHVVSVFKLDASATSHAIAASSLAQQPLIS
ncbi:MAG TPA: methyl-accepting chemotaxis protein [Burkholderiaceae bacterium]|nr:methyl-accepting chemotaxis protein [Burkholderiaceae bacterium]